MTMFNYEDHWIVGLVGFGYETRDAFSSRSFNKETKNRRTLFLFLTMGIFYIFTVTRTTVQFLIQ